jgi:hypothetical protein
MLHHTRRFALLLPAQQRDSKRRRTAGLSSQGRQAVHALGGIPDGDTAAFPHTSDTRQPQLVLGGRDTAYLPPAGAGGTGMIGLQGPGGVAAAPTRVCHHGGIDNRVTHTRAAAALGSETQNGHAEGINAGSMQSLDNRTTLRCSIGCTLWSPNLLHCRSAQLSMIAFWHLVTAHSKVCPTFEHS